MYQRVGRLTEKTTTMDPCVLDIPLQGNHWSYAAWHTHGTLQPGFCIYINKWTYEFMFDVGKVHKSTSKRSLSFKLVGVFLEDAR